jgi:hypothetical protein
MADNVSSKNALSIAEYVLAMKTKTDLSDFSYVKDGFQFKTNILTNIKLQYRYLSKCLILS